MDSFKAFLVSLASGSSFIIGTGLMFVGGALPLRRAIYVLYRI